MTNFHVDALVFNKALVGFHHELSTEDSNELLNRATNLLLDRLTEAGWARAGQHIADRVACGDILDLCNYDPDVLDLCASDQAILYQCSAFFRKRVDIDIGVDRTHTAFSKFRESESACSLTNQSFRAWSQGRFQFDPSVERVLHASIRKISQVLGDCPVIEDLRPRFGPGATTTVAKQNACPATKLRSMPSCSPNMDPYTLSECLSALYPGGYSLTDQESSSEVWTATVRIDSARLGFVPKTAKTDRAIVTEPLLNGMFQLAIGDVIARRLRNRCGIDIKDQGANQRAALYGSVSGASATLDLSSASDTISTGLVEHLLPPDWFALLNRLRSHEISYVEPGGDGSRKTMLLEKFSSMGNGFTFPLETLIFWALMSSCSEHSCPDSRIRTLVYGDDIIVDVDAVPLCLKTLASVGFTPNESKSCWSGSFRESCGHDYVLGTNVRPVFVTDRVTGSDLFRLRNFFYGKDDPLYLLFENSLHPSVRLYGPKGFGDGHLHSTTFPYRRARPEHHDGGYSFETWTSRPKVLKASLLREVGAYCKRPGKRRGFVFKESRSVLCRRVATYTQYLREERVLTLTESDRLSHLGSHVYADRRMPDASNDAPGDAFVTTPGRGLASRTRVYLLGTPPLLAA